VAKYAFALAFASLDEVYDELLFFPRHISDVSLSSARRDVSARIKTVLFSNTLEIKESSKVSP
jgi:hypothetical protein